MSLLLPLKASFYEVRLFMLIASFCNTHVLPALTVDLDAATAGMVPAQFLIECYRRPHVNEYLRDVSHAGIIA